MTARVAAFHLPEAVVKLDFLDSDDAPVQRHVAHVVDGEVLGVRLGRERGRGLATISGHWSFSAAGRYSSASNGYSCVASKSFRGILR